MIEPNISLYEVEQSCSGGTGRADLDSFRVANILHPQAYLEVALRRASGIHPELIDEARNAIEVEGPFQRSIDFEMPLQHWRLHRFALTKIALLERSSLTGRDKFRTLLDWSLNSGFFDALAILYAMRLFGRGSPPGRLIKHIQSPDAERCLAGISRAAWDLTYISYLAKQSKADDEIRFWILCTNDKGLRDLARIGLSVEGRVEDLFNHNWKPSEAAELYRIYLHFWENAQSSKERLGLLANRFEQVDTLRESLEDRIRSS